MESLRNNFELLLGLLLLALAFATLARRVQLPYPILLVVGGLILALVPGLPEVRLDPELVLLLFLPALLYGDAWDTSWRDFRANLRPISLLAFGLVFVTTAVVAVVAHWAVPGLPWAAGFALGAILSPTDAIASAAIAQRLRLPHRVVTIIQGESLVNDASGLVAYQVALGALVTGAFSLHHAVLSLLWLAGGGIGLGLAAGWVIIRLSRLLPDPTLGVVFSLLCPYLAFFPAETLHASGVLAVVAAGLYVGRASPTLLDSESRLTGRAVWESVEFVVNGLLFVLLGLQLRTVLSGLQDGGVGVGPALRAGLVVALAVMLVRILWVFPATSLPRWLSRKVRANDPMPSWRVIAVLSWSGLRGAVSLAIALSLPTTLPSGAPFPFRAELLFIAFVTVIVTLLGQGLTLPPLIRVLGVKDDGRVDRETRAAQLAVAKAGAVKADALVDSDWVPRHRVERLRDSLRERHQHLEANEKPGSGQGEGYRRVVREILQEQRAEILRLRDSGEIGDDAMRAVERDLDLEEARLSS
ncbi:MAG TPA: Na+/H+ antiporter [Myxococcaceae bacterium]|nr:Na+/H+ antiporter [Myxococcaceae bacterium]